MASYSKDLKPPFGTTTYEEVKRTYSWIIAALNSIEKKPKEIHESFLFQFGDITCSVDSYSEFSEQAFGAEGFDLITAHITAYYPEIGRINIHIGRVVSISASKKDTLEKMIDALIELEKEEQENKKNNIVYKDTVFVSGDGNIVANNKSAVTINPEPERTNSTSIVRRWLDAIGQNLAANGIWYLVVAAIGALVSYIASH